MSIKRAITVAEHMLMVLKRMKDDPQGDDPVLHGPVLDAAEPPGTLCDRAAHGA